MWTRRERAAPHTYGRVLWMCLVTSMEASQTSRTHTHTHVRLHRRNPFRTAHHISARSAQQLKRSGVCGVCLQTARRHSGACGGGAGGVIQRRLLGRLIPNSAAAQRGFAVNGKQGFAFSRTSGDDASSVLVPAVLFAQGRRQRSRRPYTDWLTAKKA